MSDEVLKRVGCLITSTLHARYSSYTQNMPNNSTLPGAGLPIFILVVIAGLVYWRIRRRRAKKN